MNPSQLPTSPSIPLRSSSFSRVWKCVISLGGVLWAGLACSLCGCGATSGWAYNQSGRRAFQQGNYTVARQEFEQAIASSPDRADYAFNLAAAMAKQGDLISAEQMYNRGIAIDPTHQPSYHGLAKMLHEQGRTAEATQLLTTWAGSQPYSSEAHLEMAWLHETTGNLAGAEQSLRQAQQIAPRDARVLAHLGQVYGQQGRKGEALALYDQALGLDPNRSEYQQQMTALYSQPAGYGNGTQMASFDTSTMTSAMSPMPEDGSMAGMTMSPEMMASSGMIPGAMPPGAMPSGAMSPGSMSPVGMPMTASAPYSDPRMGGTWSGGIPSQTVSYGGAVPPNATMSWPAGPQPTMASGMPTSMPATGQMPMPTMGAVPSLITPPPYRPGTMTAVPQLMGPSAAAAPIQNAEVPTVPAF